MGTLNVSLRRFSCALAAVLSVLLLTEGPARAQAEDQAAARALFSEGRRLAESGRYAEACATFEGARKLYTSAGILLNLADCYERTGRTASAWATFGEAASVSARTNRAEEAAEGKRRQAKLESQLMRVTLRVARDISGLVIRRDGTEVPRPAWGVPVPIDGGSHEFRADASGYVAWVQTVTVSDPGKTLTVDVPALLEAPAPDRAPPPNPAPALGKPNPLASPTDSSDSTASPGTTQRIIGISIGGAGVVSMGVAGVLAIVAKSQFNNAEKESGTARVSDSAGAGSMADAASVALIAGAVAAGAGVVLWLTAPSAPVAVGTNGTGLLLSGSF
jgi:hypothetical protein